LTLTNALLAVRSRWWLLVAGLLCGLAAATVVSWSAVPVYASTTRLFVGATGSADNADAYASGLFAEQRVQSYARVLEGDPMARRVISDLQLDLTPHELADKVSVRAVPDTVILEVTVSDGSPDRAQAIAGSIGRHAIEELTALETTAGAVDPAIRLTTLESPTLDRNPVSPDVPRDLALGVVLGLLAGLAAALLPVRLSTTVTSPDHVRDCTGRDVLGMLVEDRRLRGDRVVTDLRRHSPNREALRGIRSRLLHGHGDAAPRVVVVTGAASGEGASALAVNLAVTLAEGGTRTLLVDTDVRAPRVARYLGLPEGLGVTDVLSRRVPAEDAVRSCGDDGLLSVLTSGSVALDPSGLHESRTLRTLVTALRGSYDVVIIDAPPLDPVADAAVLAGWADACILVARHGVTRREQLATATTMLAGEQSDLFGVVLNRVPERAARRYRPRYPADPHRGPRSESGDRRPGSEHGAHRRTPAVAVTPAARSERP
jgi:capsular exopolysaccharide synthesis family protein